MKKETKIEIFFWVLAFFVFSPRVILEIYEINFKKNLIPFESSEWVVKDKNRNIVYDKLAIPIDLRWKEKGKRSDWIFEKELNVDHLKNIENLGIVLGRMGDNDYVLFNDCLIGYNGLHPSKNYKDQWFWSQLRRYSIPKDCIKYPVSKVQVHIQKIVASGYGIYAGPLGFGSIESIEHDANILDYLRYNIVFAFGIGLIFFVAIHYFFINFISYKRKIYGIFSFLALSIGAFLTLISTYPYRAFGPSPFLFKLLFLSAVCSSWGFIDVFKYKFEIRKNYILVSYKLIGSAILLIAFFQNDADKVYSIYELWFPIFLIVFLLFFIQIVFKKIDYADPFLSKYKLSYAIFVICCLHDVYLTYLGLPNAHLIPYGFVFFVLVVGLTLSQEYSDAFSKVEHLVVIRTNQLKEALTNIQEVQRLKDDQAKRFAHDIRSPLAALQVLKDVISRHLSDDEKSLFKHTIVRINDLSNTALPKLIGGEKNIELQTEVFLWPVVDKLISEKRLEYQHLPDVTIELKNLSPIFDLHAKCNEIEVTRILSNLVNNSIEARKISEPLYVNIAIQKNQNWIQLSIEDNGNGVPEEVLSRVFDEGFTHGKKGGMGIGLKHAKSTIESWDGMIEISSIENQGTEISFKIPLSDSPGWVLTKLDISGITDLVVIDDQPFVVDAWKQKLQNLPNAPRLLWIQNMEAWKQADISSLSMKKTLFLVDQDLSSSITGLDMIKQLKLGPNVALVTGNEDDLILRKRAIDLGILILPKALIHNIPIEVKAV